MFNTFKDILKSNYIQSFYWQGAGEKKKKKNEIGIFSVLAFTMMIGLALKRTKNGETKCHKVEVFLSFNLPKFFEVAVYSFMCQHSLPRL